MPELTCPNCGAEIERDPRFSEYTCPECGETFYDEEWNDTTIPDRHMRPVLPAGR